MKELIYKYLGYKSILPDEKIDSIIDLCIEEVKSISKFKYYYQEYKEPLDFMLNNKSYLDYLSGSTSFLLISTTLGIEIDIRERFLSASDPLKALIFDACSNAYIEYMADEYEKSLNRECSYRFCPGYQGTNFLDNQIIASELNVNKILGISFLESGLMLPLKSMIGIVAIGNNKKKTCKNCMFLKSCNYLKEGLVCYRK